MLFEMYQGFAKQMNWNCETVGSQYDGTCLRSGILRIRGDDISSYLSQESGIHRLVRISPFDKNSRRHTSFASVTVSPVLQRVSKRETLRQQDLQIDRFKASGPGGQYVNKTESAVRITHIPTGIVVECQAQRNQHQNQEMAMELLQAKLDRREQEQEELTKKQSHDNKDPNSWSSQIRSYVLHPYTVVKDHRFGVDDSDVRGILSGNLREFVDEVVRRKLYSDYGLAKFNKE